MRAHDRLFCITCLSPHISCLSQVALYEQAGLLIISFEGIVVANFGAAVALQDAQGALHRSIPLKKLPPVVAGDRVQCAGTQADDLRITALLPRSSVLTRPDRRGNLRPLAANLTHLVIVSAVNPPPVTLLIDQFCVVAETAAIGAIVVMNKSDLADEKELQKLQEILDIYSSVGYPTAMIHTRSPAGLAPLVELLKGHSGVLVGQSGVGKSSIVQGLLPDLDIRIGAISAATGIGAHTTTVSFRYELESGGVLIDSPGVRQFSVEHLTPEQIAWGYREISDAAADCRFANCRHQVEPDCAVRLAVLEKRISPIRYANFIKNCNRGS